MAGLAGLALGSFMASCAYRLPRKISLVTVRSFCPNCGHGLLWYELIPLLSFAIQRGRCRSCATRISREYPIIEGVAAVTAIHVVSGSAFQVQGVIGTIFCLLMILIAVIDLEHFVIPNILVVAGLV
ncbi:MAG: prepilin peptidase [Bacteroidota bacterium]